MRKLELSDADQRRLTAVVARGGWTVKLNCETLIEIAALAKAEAMTEASLLELVRTTQTERTYIATDYARSLCDLANIADNFNEVRYARSFVHKHLLLFFTPTDRDAYVQRRASLGFTVVPLTAAQAFKMTRPSSAGRRKFFAPTLGQVVSER